jgi:hypothetical protein
MVVALVGTKRLGLAGTLVLPLLKGIDLLYLVCICAIYQSGIKRPTRPRSKILVFPPALVNCARVQIC